MIHTYTKKLEQIVADMGMELQSGTTHIPDSEYEQWLAFLRQVYPESELFAATPKPQIFVDPTPLPLSTLKIYEDIREIMMLAEINGYPTWYVQPHFLGLSLILHYQQGTLQKIKYEDGNRIEQLELKSIQSVPTHIPQFTGVVKGTLYMSREEYTKYEATDSASIQVATYQTYLGHESTNLHFTAFDIGNGNGFMEKASLLESYGFSCAEYVLFPTSRLSTISSSKLETFFNSYLAKAQETGFVVDGLTIISDAPLTLTGEHATSNRILYKCNVDST